MPDDVLKRNSDKTIRYDPAVTYLRSAFAEYEVEVARVAVSPK